MMRAGVATSAEATIYLAKEPFTAPALAVALALDWFAYADTLDEVIERAIVLTDRGLPVWGWARQEPWHVSFTASEWDGARPARLTLRAAVSRAASLSDGATAERQ